MIRWLFHITIINSTVSCVLVLAAMKSLFFMKGVSLVVKLPPSIPLFSKDSVKTRRQDKPASTSALIVLTFTTSLLPRHLALRFLISFWRIMVFVSRFMLPLTHEAHYRPKAVRPKHCSTSRGKLSITTLNMHGFMRNTWNMNGRRLKQSRNSSIYRISNLKNTLRMR